jgi:A/G-specific adenine glycosylase
MARRNGRFPTKREEIESLPGIGQYIANAIEVFCSNKRRPLLDVNMARVLERYFGPRKLADIRYDPYLQKLAHDVLPRKKIKEFNWAILDFGALVCKARNPACNNCSLAKKCKFP